MEAMSDRKYRQRGYQDDDRDRPSAPKSARPAPEPGAPAGARRISGDARRPSTCPATAKSSAAPSAATSGPPTSATTSRCPRCGTDLHACAQCASFDPGSRFECMQTIPARISPKNARNSCELFAPRTTVERETTTPRTDDAAEGVRRSVQVLAQVIRGLAFRTGPADRFQPTGRHHTPRSRSSSSRRRSTHPTRVLIAKQVLDEVVSLSDADLARRGEFRPGKRARGQVRRRTGSQQWCCCGETKTPRMRFLGAPAGYEFVSLIEALVLAGTGDSGLTPESKALVAAHVTTPTEHPRVRDADLPALPPAVTLAHRTGGRKPPDPRHLRGGHGVPRPVAAIPGDRRAEDGRQRHDRDVRRSAGERVRQDGRRRAGAAGTIVAFLTTSSFGNSFSRYSFPSRRIRR